MEEHYIIEYVATGLINFSIIFIDINVVFHIFLYCISFSLICVHELTYLSIDVSIVQEIKTMHPTPERAGVRNEIYFMHSENFCFTKI